MKLRLLLLAVALFSTQPAFPAASLVDQARAAMKAERLDHAEQLLRRHLRSHRTDLDARFHLARVLSWQGKRREALIEYDVLIKANPRDGDYLLGKAQTLVWDGKPEQALPLLRKARRIAPRYEEIWRLQITALIALGDEYRLRQARVIRAEAAARFPRSQWQFAGLDPPPVPAPSSAPETASLPVPAPISTTSPAIEQPPPPVKAEIDVSRASAATEPAPELKPAKPASPVGAAAQRRSEFELGATAESLSNGNAGWRSIYLDGLHRFGERHVLYGTLRETRRFGFTDSEAQAGLYYPLGETWTSLVEATVSPTNDVLPNYSLLGHLQKSLGHGWDLQAAIRHSEYGSYSTKLGFVTAERYWSNFRGAYSLYLGRLDGEGSVAPNHVVQFDYYYGDRNSIGIVLAHGREIADLGPNGALITDVRSYVLRGRHWLTPDWAVSFEALHHEQGTLYTRRGARIGLRGAF